MSKFLYPIYKLKTKSYIKWWLYHKKAGGSGVLSEILEGFSFNLENTLNRKFKLFEIEGNSVQDGTPSPDNEVPILSSGDNGSINEKIGNKNYLSLSEATVGTAGVTANISETKMKFSGKMASVTNIFNTIREDKAVPAGTYKLSYTKLSGSTSGSGDWAVYFNFYNANGTRIAKNNFASNDIVGGTVKDLVLSEDVAYYSYYAYCNSTSLIFNDLELGFMITKDTPTDYIAHKEQTYTIPVQQPMRSIGDVRDKFVKVNGNWFERHLPYIASYNGETLPTDVYTEEGGIKYCNSKSMSTTGQFSNGASVQYVDENNWNYLPCTEEQIEQLENKPSTYKDFTIIQSQDETPAHLKIQYYKEG